ncbi:MAG: hypothetical protein U0R19_36305 [Bryobacteraceae bacterium]
MEHKPQIISNDDDLVQELQGRITGGVQLIAIDGFSGAGKSTTSRLIARACQIDCIELDHFVERNPEGAFLEFINYARLAESVRIHRAAKKAVLIEGVCVQAVLKQISVAESLHVYVKRTGPYRLWYDGVTLDRFPTLEDALAYEQRLLGSMDGLTRDVLRYHYDYMPHQTADLVYERQQV